MLEQGSSGCSILWKNKSFTLFTFNLLRLMNLISRKVLFAKVWKRCALPTRKEAMYFKNCTRTTSSFTVVFKIRFILIMCMCVLVCVCVVYVCAPLPGIGRWHVCMSTKATRGQWPGGPLELESQVVVSRLMGGRRWHQVFRKNSSGSYFWAISSSPFLNVLNDQCTIFFLKIPVHL